MTYKTRSEQRLEYLQGLGRPLTPDESDELRRAMHAVYCIRRKDRIAGAWPSARLA